MTSLNIIKKLVSFPTVSANSNLELIRFCQKFLEDCGASTRIFLDSSGQKANLLGVMGPTDRAGVILSGHTDVVPVKGQSWTRDPFIPWIENKRLYGRGTADMKSFIGLSLFLAQNIKEEPLKMPVYFAFSYDEEVGCTGVLSMVDYLKTIHPKPKACIVGEPTEMLVINSHKGIQSYCVKIKGAPAHSSLPDLGADAVKAATQLVAWLYDEAESLKGTKHDHRFDPPYSTLNVGLIKGGAAINIVPEHAEFCFEHRNLPETDGKALVKRLSAYIQSHVLPELTKKHSEARIDIETISEVPPLRMENDNPAETLAYLLSGTNDSGAVSYATEAGLFQQTAGIPTVVCGPGSIEQAHRADEFITLEQIAAGESFMKKLEGYLLA